MYYYDVDQELTERVEKDRWDSFMSKMKWQRFLIPLFTFIYWKRLFRECSWHNGYYFKMDKVVHVKGWRTAIIDSPGGGRITSTFCFKYFFKD